jgi:hypothetical protein
VTRLDGSEHVTREAVDTGVLLPDKCEPSTIIGRSGGMTDDTKAKRPKRRKDHPEPWVKAPKGAYNSGIYDQYILMRLGAVCGIWTHIEEAMIDFFSFLLGNTAGAARPVFRSIVNREAALR